MYYNPYSTVISNYYRAPQPNSYVRVFNASPNAPAVDVYANEVLIAKNLGYKQLTQYIPMPVGNYNIKIYPTGQTSNPLLVTDVYIPPNTIFNLTIVGEYPNISLYTIPEPVSAQNFGRPCIRFINLSPNAPALDVSLSTGSKIFNNVGYKNITDYACIPAGTYNFNITPVGTNNTLLSISNAQLNPNNYYTIYAIGLANSTFPLEAVVVQEPR